MADSYKVGDRFISITTPSDEYEISAIENLLENAKKRTDKNPFRKAYCFDLYRDGKLYKKTAFKMFSEGITDMLKIAWQSKTDQGAESQVLPSQCDKKNGETKCDEKTDSSNISDEPYDSSDF